MEMPLVEIGTSVSLIKAVICLYGFALFVWWWKVNDDASQIYICFTFLLFGLSIDNGVEAFARYRWLYYGVDDVRYTIWWPLRLIPSLIPLCGIIWTLTLRALKAQKEKKDEQKP